MSNGNLDPRPYPVPPEVGEPVDVEPRSAWQAAANFAGGVLVTGMAVALVAYACNRPDESEKPDYNPYQEPVNTEPRPSPTPVISIRPQPSAIQTEVEYDQACLAALRHPGVTLEKAGCQILKGYAADGSETGNSTFGSLGAAGGCGGQEVAYIETANGQLKLYTGGMPKRFQEAIEWAIKDPIIQRLAAHAEGGFVFWLGKNYRSAAEYQSAYDDGKDAVHFCLTLGEDDDNYPAFSALRGTMRHELGHALHDDIRKLAETNPQMAQLLEELNQANLDELRLVTEKTRASMQARATQVLTGLYEDNAPDSEEAQIIKYVLDSFSRPNGLDDLFVEVDKNGEPHRMDIHTLDHESLDMFALAARALGYQYSYGSTWPKSDPVNEIVMYEGSDLKKLSEDFQEAVAKAYGYIDEGTVVSAFDVGGHPELTTGEWFASAVASIPADPLAVVNAILKLPAKQRQLVTRKLELIEQIIAIAEPGLEHEMSLSLVVSKLRSAKAAASYGINGAFETVGVYRDGMWTVSAEWAAQNSRTEREHAELV